MITRQEGRKLIRQAVKRVPEGEEIRHLNIMPMMDMMTILLVFMIKQAATDASAFQMSDLDPPPSNTTEPPPELSTQITIARSSILIDGIPVVSVRAGDIDASEKPGGALGLEVPKISSFLADHRESYRQSALERGLDPKSATDELSIIADRETPYRLLFTVMNSARKSCPPGENCYRRFRLIVFRTAGD
jgi:biopolymer transport protein ExbD